MSTGLYINWTPVNSGKRKGGTLAVNCNRCYDQHANNCPSVPQEALELTIKTNSAALTVEDSLNLFIYRCPPFTLPSLLADQEDVSRDRVYFCHQLANNNPDSCQQLMFKLANVASSVLLMLRSFCHCTSGVIQENISHI